MAMQTLGSPWRCGSLGRWASRRKRECDRSFPRLDPRRDRAVVLLGQSMGLRIGGTPLCAGARGGSIVAMTNMTPRGRNPLRNQVVSCERQGLPLSRQLSVRTKRRLRGAGQGPRSPRDCGPASAFGRMVPPRGRAHSVICLAVAARTQHEFLLKEGDVNT
jgi:hypothetical protein